MTQNELELRLSHMKYLCGLTYPALRRVSRLGRLRSARAGDIIIGPRLGSNSAFFVLEGSIAAVMPWGPVLARLGPGEVFGEMALVHGVERSAYCKAEVDSLLFELPFNSFQVDLLANPVVRGALEEITLIRRAAQYAIRNPSASEEEEEPEIEHPEGELEDAEPAAAAEPDEPQPPAIYATA